MQRVVLGVGGRQLSTYVAPLLELQRSQPTNMAKIRTLSPDVNASPELEVLDMAHMHVPGLFVPCTVFAPSTTSMNATSPYLSPSGVTNDVFFTLATDPARSITAMSPSVSPDSVTEQSSEDITPLPATNGWSSTHRSSSSISSATGGQAPCNFYFILGRCALGVRFILTRHF